MHYNAFRPLERVALHLTQLKWARSLIAKCSEAHSDAYRGDRNGSTGVEDRKIDRVVVPPSSAERMKIQYYQSDRPSVERVPRSHPVLWSRSTWEKCDQELVKPTTVWVGPSVEKPCRSESI